MPYLVNGQPVPEEWIREEEQRIGPDLRFNAIETLNDSCKSPNEPALVAPVPPALAPEPAAAPPLEPALAPPVTSVSYSSLGEYARCGYRFYAQRVLGLPELSDERGVPMRSGDATAVERSGAVGD